MQTTFATFKFLLPRCFLFALISLFSQQTWAQTTYYVAGNGSDGNDGRSAASPYQSLAKVNSLSLRAGDAVLFRRGDTFQGTLQISQSGSGGSPIVLDAYGDGNKPSLAGSVTVTNWTNIGNNVWQANCSACGSRVTGVYRDNTALPLGRYPNLDSPNKGYLTVQSHNGKSQLTSQQSLSTNWTGGEAVFRPVQWILNRAKITGQSGNTLNLDGSGTYDVRDNWGYFIQNHPATLDQTGEWYYNPANKTVQLYDSQSNPNNQRITATAFAQAVNITGASFVTIRNLQLTQSLETSLLVTNGSNLVISNNDITQSAEDGVLIQGSGSQVLMEGNLVENVNNNGVNIGGYQNVTFRGNTIRNIGLVPGLGKSGDGNYVGFQSFTTANTLIEDNVVNNIGYNAVNFSNSTTVRHNQISNFCITKSDGSGLYIWNGNQQPMSDIHLTGNIVYNGIGAREGSPSDEPYAANGIYLDDCSANIEVADNSVYNCTGLGIFLHGTSNIRVTGNTVYNNNSGQLSVTSANNCQPRNNYIQNNVFVTKQPNQFNVKFESNQNDLGSYGDIDNNVYARPFEDTYKVLAVYNQTVGAALTLEQWQSRYGKDLHTLNSPVTYSSGNPDDYIRFFVNPTSSPTQVSLDGTYRDARNALKSGQITIPAFSSIVLFKDIVSSTPLRDPENPANAVTGLNYQYYEGNWNNVPDFNSLTPVKTGTFDTPTLSVRNRDDNFGLRMTGYISVPTDGVYTFFTSTDDGSKLLIGTTEVVNNDGGHPEQERSGMIGLKAGVHAISIPYFQGSGGQALSVSYSGPGIGKQVIPASAFRRVGTTTTPPPTPPMGSLRDPENPANAVSGLDYQYYEGNWNNVPDFNSLTPVKTGTIDIPTLSVRNRDDNFGLRMTGYISVPTDGVYTFFTSTDDGSKLLIGTTEVVNNDGGHPEQERSGTIGLKAGVHAISIPYFQGSGGQALSVSYSGPGIGKQVIPASAFRRVGTTTTPPPTPPTGSLRDPENPANAVSGLDYQYYEGSWGSLPDFGAMTPLKIGTIDIPTLSVRNRDDNFGLRMTGYISVPTDGVYTFFTSTDDGSKLLIGTTEVVNNDGGHPEQERSGTIGLKAGVHAISIPYFQGSGGQALSVSYSGPGIGKQLIPASSFFRTSSAPVVGSGTGTGLQANYFNNPNLNPPVALSRIDQTIDFDWGDGSPAAGTINNDNFSIRWTGKIEAPATGNYTFTTISDDGIRLWVNGSLIIDNWTGHAPTINNSQSVALTAGQKYDIRMEYYEGPGGAAIRLSWMYPGQSQQVIPKNRMYPTTNGGRVAASADNEFNPDVLLQVYPVPAHEEVTVRYYATVAGQVKLQLTNLAASSVIETIHSVLPGENIIRMPVRSLARGLYIMTLTQEKQRISRKVILTN